MNQMLDHVVENPHALPGYCVRLGEHGEKMLTAFTVYVGSPGMCGLKAAASTIGKYALDPEIQKAALRHIAEYTGLFVMTMHIWAVTTYNSVLDWYETSNVAGWFRFGIDCVMNFE